MDAKTLEALKAAIGHWEENLAAESPGYARTGSDHCALCALFYEQSKPCVGCPVREKTGNILCYGSPYGDAYRAWVRWGDFPRSNEAEDKWRLTAQAEVDFLKSLLPKES